MRLSSLTARIAVFLGLATVLLLGVAAVLMDHLVDAEMTQRFDATLVSQANAIAALVEIGPHGVDSEDLQRKPPRLLLGDARAMYVIRCHGGDEMQSDPPPTKLPRAWARRARVAPAFADVHAGDLMQRAVWFRFTPGKGDDPPTGQGQDALVDSCSILLIQSRTQLDDILYTIDGILLIIPMLALALVLVLSPLLVRRGLQPLVVLAERMRSIGPNAPGKRLTPGTTRELTPLVARFNEVLERMDAGMIRERRFAGALAHETRTRLAELRTLVDVERRHPSGRDTQDMLAEIGLIGGELEDIVTSLLLLTRLEAGIEKAQSQAVDPHALITRQVEAVNPMLERRQIQLRTSSPADDFSLTSDTSLLGMVLGNLLHNAAAHAAAGSHIRMQWSRSGFEIVNHAPELTPEDIAHFGQRYWQKTRGDTGNHAGLGLSLASAAASALGLQLHFELDAEHDLHACLDWSMAVSDT